MPLGKQTPPEQRQRIVDLLQEHGGNRNKVAKIVGVSPATVQKIANEEGITSAIQRRNSG